MSFYNLPTELICCLAEYLCPCNYISLATTCKWLYGILSDPVMRKKVITITNEGHDTISTDARTGLRCGVSIRRWGAGGSVVEYVHYHRGERNGISKNFLRGNLSQLCTYRDGLMEDYKYEFNKRGQVNVIESRKDGLIHGYRFSWEIDGTFVMILYEKGVRLDTHHFYPDGALKLRAACRGNKSFFEHWNRDGTIRGREIYDETHMLKQTFHYDEKGFSHVELNSFDR